MQLTVRQFTGLQPYQQIWQAMRAFTDSRTNDTPDEIWLLEHHPVFTQGQAGLAKHLINAAHTIPVIQTDRGGQITYHGPGQLLIYTLWDVKRLNITIREMVTGLEDCIINVLKALNIPSTGKREAPGVYTADGKIASIGLRIRNHCSYHGIAINLDMDLQPFSYINPCGFEKLCIKQLADYHPDFNQDTIMKQIIDTLCLHFRYNALNPILTNLDELTTYHDTHN